MSTFSMTMGGSEICSWDIGTQELNSGEATRIRNGMLLIKEMDRLGFVLNPAPSDSVRIFVGDLAVSDLTGTLAGAMIWSNQLFWPEFPYFESARGKTRLILESQENECGNDLWREIFGVDVYVIPSKISEEKYDVMAKDLQSLSRNLLVDLYGKSNQTYDLRFAKEGKAFQSNDKELIAIETVLDRLSHILGAIAQRPASCMKTRPFQQKFWGAERLSPVAFSVLCKEGNFRTNDKRPILINTRRKIESFDIAEHRVTKKFLQILLRRAKFCLRVTKRHIKSIKSDQDLRDVRFGNEPTLYESVDLPKIRRLTQVIQRARQSILTISSLARLSFLNEVRPQLVAVKEGTFQRSPEYKALLSLIRRFLISNAVWYEGNESSTVTKLTSRLFEQWCYLKIVEAFRNCGLELREWKDALRDNLKSQFILDFVRNLTFEGQLTADLRLRIRYEPWIRNEGAALNSEETVYRGSGSSNIAWCPDVLIECLRVESGQLIPLYGIVLDCKYTTRLNEKKWNDVQKYLQIRSTINKQQVVKQAWLIAPSDQVGIESEDSAVEFDSSGPSCLPHEAVLFCLRVTPDETDSNPFVQFAAGTINYFRRAFQSS